MEKKWEKRQPRLNQRAWTEEPRFSSQATRDCSFHSFTLTKANFRCYAKGRAEYKAKRVKIPASILEGHQDEERHQVFLVIATLGRLFLWSHTYPSWSVMSLLISSWFLLLCAKLWSFPYSTFSHSWESSGIIQTSFCGSCISLWGSQSEDFMTQLDKMSRSCSRGIIQL